MSQITYVGHATVLVEMDGVRLLTDPTLKNWGWHLRRRGSRVNPLWYQNIDAVLISHIHWDHFHLPPCNYWLKLPLLLCRAAWPPS